MARTAVLLPTWARSIFMRGLRFFTPRRIFREAAKVPVEAMEALEAATLYIWINQMMILARVGRTFMRQFGPWVVAAVALAAASAALPAISALAALAAAAVVAAPPVRFKADQAVVSTK